MSYDEDESLIHYCEEPEESDDSGELEFDWGAWKGGRY